MRGLWTGPGLFVLVLAGAPVAATAAVRYVASNGSGTTCTVTAPCRTIGQAIAIASAGDRIIVGPGVYGDVNRDGAFTGPSDEPAQVGSGCGCVIRIDRTVTLESSAGAGATIIEAGGARVDVILVEAPDVVIGRRDKGFTVRGGRRGIFVDAADVRIEGNTITGGTEAGITTFHGTVVRGNFVHDNGRDGLDVQGGGNTVAGNTVVSNLVGILLFGTGHLVTDNIVTHNRVNGIELGPPGTDLKVNGNTIVRNRGAGVQVQPARPGDYAGTLITGNNVYGNGLVTSANCGVENQHAELVKAERNYWGAATGPGANPADSACGNVDAVPFATRAFAITNDAGR
jgi:parallel beta-helix repeat protein